MLYLDSPIFFLNSLQIHRDFQNPNQFYYFPAAPRIHRDRVTGRPSFQLLKYARDVTDNPNMPPDTKEELGGGFLTMTVDIGVDDEVLQDTRNKLASYADGEVSLAPVPFHTGAVRLVALGAEGQPTGEAPATPTNVFVEKLFGATKPSLYGDNLALFGVHLSQEGATLVEDSFAHGGGLIGVVYDLTYTGIRPALQVKAEVDYARVYDRFEAQVGFQYAVISAELDATLEWLREQGAITIEITEYDAEASGESALRTEAMGLIKNEIIAKMFKPSLTVPAAATKSAGPLEQATRMARDLSQPPAPSATGEQKAETPAAVTEGERGPRTMEGRPTTNTAGTSTAGTPGFSLSFSLKYVHQDERKRATLDFRANQAVNRTAAPQGSLVLLTGQLADTPRSELIREVNLDDPFFHELRARIGVTGDWGELGIDKVVVNATYQPNPTGPIVHTDGWTFAAPNEPARPFNVLIDRENPVRRYRYTTQVFLKDLANIESKTRVLVKDDSTAQRDLVIHPANELRPIQIALEAGPIDWNITRQVDVVLKYDDPAHEFQAQQLFSFRQDRLAPQKWVVYPQDPELRGYEITFAYHLNDADNTYFRLAPLHSTEEAVIVPGPFRGAPRRVQLIPAVKAEDVRGISAEILFEKGGYRFHRQEDFGADDLKPRWVQIPVPDPDPKSDAYQVRWSITTADWDVQDHAWRTMTTTQCLLGDGAHGVESIKLVFTRSVAEAGLTSLVVTVETLAPTGDVIDDDTLVLRGAATEAATQLLVLQASPLAYRYRLKKVIGADSQSVESTTNHARRLVVDL